MKEENTSLDMQNDIKQKTSYSSMQHPTKEDLLKKKEDQLVKDGQSPSLHSCSKNHSSILGNGSGYPPSDSFNIYKKIIGMSGNRQDDSNIPHQDRDRKVEEKRAITVQACKEAAEEKQRIIAQAQAEREKIIAQAQAEREKIIESANNRANRIIDRAYVAANEAKKRFLELSKDRLDNYNAENDTTMKEISAVKEALVRANESIRLLEDSVFEGNTRKASNQLIELYNLIADTKDSTFSLFSQKNCHDLENAAHNLENFMDMLVEYLADYGIQTIASFPGATFSARYHASVGTGNQFDFRNARISRSLRNGFMWDEQVLQKEKVEIEGDKNVFGY